MARLPLAAHWRACRTEHRLCSMTNVQPAAASHESVEHLDSNLTWWTQLSGAVKSSPE